MFVGQWKVKCYDRFGACCDCKQKRYLWSDRCFECFDDEARRVQAANGRHCDGLQILAWLDRSR